MMRNRMMARALVASALMLGTTAVASAQLANASTAATGLGGAFTARATGYNAVFWNPANLAMPGNPGFSMTLLAFDGQAGIKPIDFKKFAEYDGVKIPATVREEWLKEVETEGGENGGFGFGLTGLGLSMGPFAFQVNTKLAGDMNLSPGVVEAVLFGNAGRTGSPTVVNFAGSKLQSSVYTTGAISYGIPLSVVPLTNFTAGVTAKYIVGHGLLYALDNGSNLNGSNIDVNFPIVMTDTNSYGAAAKGLGLDLGAAWTIPGVKFGVSMQNVINTFKWDTTKMSSRSAVGYFHSDGTSESFTPDTVDKPYTDAPAVLRERVAALKFKPVLAAGVSFDWLPKVILSADVRQQFGDGIEVGPNSLIAAGAEVKLIPFIPLRAGVQMMSGGFGFSGGVGLHLLGFEAGVGGYVRQRAGGSESGATINVFSIRP